MTLSHDGVERRFELHLPADYDCTPRPVLVGLHGYYGSGADFERGTARMAARVDELGYIGVFPDGLPMGEEGARASVTSFNDIDSHNSEGPDGPTCTGRAYDYGVYDNCPPEEAEDACNWGTSCADDAGYLRALVGHVSERWSVDAARVYLTGFSQGGQTTQSLGARMPDVFTAIAPHHGFAANGYTAPPTSPQSLFQVWATNDRTVDGNGRASSDGMIYDSAEETRLAWAEAQGCASEASAYPTSFDGVEGWRCVEHAGCSTGAQVVSCAWDGGHTWGRSGAEAFALETMLRFFEGAPQLSASADDPQLQYVGRVPREDPAAATLHWPGSAVRARFEGSSLTLFMDDAGDNYVNVIIDGGEPLVVDCAPGPQRYLVAEGLSEGVHSVEVNKRTESHEGDLRFRGLGLDPGAGLQAPPERPALRIEFYGDSITSGMSVDSAADSDAPEYKDNYRTYAGLTARALGAEYHSLSLSGVGILASWWPATIYDYWDSLSGDDHAWRFDAWQADIVVVNLGQNDRWLGVGAEIVDAYVDFLGGVREVYPQAELFLAIGSMDAVAPGSPFPDYVRAAVASMNDAGDEAVHAVVFDYNGSGRHPVASEHAQMAETLTAAILEEMPELAR